jgi:hypothetical protein
VKVTVSVGAAVETVEMVATVHVLYVMEAVTVQLVQGPDRCQPVKMVKKI